MESPARCVAPAMVGGSTRPLIGCRGVGNEAHAAKYGKRSSVRTGTGVCVCVTHRPPTTAADSLRKPKKDK